MTADVSKHTDQDLEALFEAVRNEPADASPDLLARVLADAYDQQDARTASAGDAPAAAPPRGLPGRLLEMIGGWPAAAGLSAAVMAGLWIGYNPPEMLDDLTLAFLDGGYGAELSIGAQMPAYDDLLADG